MSSSRSSGKSGPQSRSGRVLVFAGDTTWCAGGALRKHWPRMMLLEADHALARLPGKLGRVRLDQARRAASSAGIDQRLGFNVGLRGKGGVELKNAEFEDPSSRPEEEGRKVEDGGRKTDVTSPPPAARRPPSFDVPIMAEDDGRRGYFLKTDTPGEYRVKVLRPRVRTAMARTSRVKRTPAS